jgi:hypothetical protein
LKLIEIAASVEMTPGVSDVRYATKNDGMVVLAAMLPTAQVTTFGFVDLTEQNGADPDEVNTAVESTAGFPGTLSVSLSVATPLVSVLPPVFVNVNL